MILKSLTDCAIDALFPRRCPVCGRIVVPRGRLICPGCINRLSWVKQPVCKSCGKELSVDTVEYCFDCARRPRSFVYGRGGSFEDMTTPEAVQGMQDFIDIYTKGYVPPTATSDGFNEIIANFKSGLTAMTIHHTGSSADMEATFVYQPDDPAATLPGGESVVLVTGPGGTESGEDAMLWQGIQTFANTYGYTADAQTAAGNTADEAEAALRTAAESGAKLVVCRGDTMGAALYRMQENYPDVHYLLFDSEPHSDDYSAYNTASLVHCVLFQEEQAGYLAGYAAVTDGYTTLGFIGAREVPGIVRYCTGFLQGAEAAAELQGEYVTLQTWFTDTYENNDAITQRMIDWYNNGTSLIMVSGGNLYEGVSDAVNQTGGKAITTDYDNTELGDRVLGSAIKCYNAAVQRQLYTFFAAGTWNGQTGGQTEKAGFTNGEVALEAGAPWRFDSFTQDDYRTLYEDLRTSVLKVDAYSDLDTLPETPNVTVDRLL